MDEARRLSCSVLQSQETCHPVLSIKLSPSLKRQAADCSSSEFRGGDRIRQKLRLLDVIPSRSLMAKGKPVMNTALRLCYTGTWILEVFLSRIARNKLFFLKPSVGLHNATQLQANLDFRQTISSRGGTELDGNSRLWCFQKSLSM